jgi:demethylmenaquinone methyltransferase / 2-methoxy-6-polyprenyl-1,4-benzoquinol methylase
MTQSLHHPVQAMDVNRMFARIAPTYDLMNRIMTGGQDVRWRRAAIALCDLPAGGLLLDVGAGTGDLARTAEAHTVAHMPRYTNTVAHTPRYTTSPGVRAVGVDFTYEMMAAGRAPQGGFVQGDTCRLPFADNSFDAVVSGFLIRNVVDRAAALREQARVVKPGGRVVCLETTPPAAGGLTGPLFQFYFFRVVPWLGGLISGDREAYAYLPHSTQNFATPNELAHLMEHVGLRDVFYVPRMFGAVAIHVGTKIGDFE